MIEKDIELEAGAPLIVREIGGDFKLAGWDEPHVMVQVDSDDEHLLQVDETPGGVEIRAHTNCDIFVPNGTPVTVDQAMGNMKARETESDLTIGQAHGDLKVSDARDVSIAEVFGNLRAADVESLRVESHVHGDAKVTDVRGAVSLGNVGGNLRVRDVAELQAGRVSGDLLAKDVERGVQAGQVGGNAILSDLGGPASVGQVSGDLLAKNLTGGASIPAIGGNLVLGGELGAGVTYRFQAAGDAVLKLDEEAGAHVMLRAGSEVLASVKLADEERSRRQLSGTLGEGGAELAVEAGGNVVLRRGPSVRVQWDENQIDFDPFNVELGEEISRQIQESLRGIDMAAIGRKANEEVERAMDKVRSKLEGVDWERLGAQAQGAMERAMAQMQRDLDRMAERAARQQERAARLAQRAAERSQRRPVRPAHADWQPEGAFRAGPPEPPPSFDEERLSILKMVEQGQISIEEAETLLDALR